MRNLLVLLLLSVSALSTACGASPDACEKGDDEACNKLCETGKPETQHYCFTARARQVKACVEKDVDCPKACDLWKSALIDETTRDYYRTNWGEDKTTEAIAKKCDLGSAAPAGDPAAPAATP